MKSLKAPKIPKLNSLAGTIERRMLINYRVDPEAAAAIVPPGFEPLLVGDYAMAGICLIQLRVRPNRLPRSTGIRSINGAHRIAVIMPDGSEAVYVPRRDTDSSLNVTIGGRLFPGHLHRADFTAGQIGQWMSLDLTSRDGSTRVSVTAADADRLPKSSVFATIEQASDFYERGAIGYSDRPTEGHYDGLELQTSNWSVTPLAIAKAESSFFEDQSMFPPGTAELDHGLIMRDVHHRWHRRSPLVHLS